MQFLSSITPLMPDYDALLLDLWGVIHDGSQLYPGVKSCLEELRRHQKKVIFLSNAPRRAATVASALAAMGIDTALYDSIITSGEAAYTAFASGELKEAFATKNYYYIGLEKDRGLIQPLGYQEVATLNDAQFLLLTHSYYDNQPWEELAPVFEAAVALHVPIICVNPDTEVVRLSGEQVQCAGALAARVDEMQGTVWYFGKPHAAIYKLARMMCADTKQERILAIGDNLHTDIRGGVAAGITTALVSGGILRPYTGMPQDIDYSARCRTLCEASGYMPDYIIPAFV